MTDQHNPKTASDVLKALHLSLCDKEPDFESMPIENVLDYLKESGTDHKHALEFVQNEIKITKRSLALERAKKRKKTIKNAFSKGAKKVKRTKEEVERLIKFKFSENDAMVYMRKFEEVPAEDLSSLLEDLELLEQIEQEDEE